MPDDPPFHIAETTFHHLLAARGLVVEQLRPDGALRIFRTFAEIHFESPAKPTSDGLRYRFGPDELRGRPAVSLVLGRRFGVRASNGTTSRYVELRCTMRFFTTPELAEVDEHESWWFHSRVEQLDMDEWFASITARPEWVVLRWHHPVEVKLVHIEL
ncbi:hypothetical protein GCM10012275_18290 [Longimycelium tulufanense]|uniref:Uncharacterized protein n=1 Tax=Longimycelium tulufanense TaxID=907463 RepID=A0A8J3FT97_9PSEU|nr:hypothetical protein [Longimycelium tulufanense]GGM47536.1 hypothetical protein GCM10012275_18290 [Longimycelium tulufanense]